MACSAGHSHPIRLCRSLSAQQITMGALQSTPEKSSSSSSRAGDGRALPAPPSSAASCTNSNNHAQSKRAPAPHMFGEIVAKETTAGAAEELQDQVNTGAAMYLAAKTKKYWLHEKTRCNCFMLFPRGLSITWSEDPRYWSWQPLKEEGDAEIEAALLQNVCWLEIHGKIELSHLTPGVNYEAIFEVMLTEPAYGWSVPVNLRLKFPGGAALERKENLDEKPRGQWLELKAGEVKAQQGQKGEMEISMFEYDGGDWKKGLLIKGIKIVPKE